VTGRIKNPELLDVMFPAQLTDAAWAKSDRYDNLFDHPVFACSKSVREDSLRTLVIAGIFNDSGQQLRRLFPTFRFPWALAVTPSWQSGPFLAVVVDDLGMSHRASFDATIAGDRGFDDESYGYFSVAVAVAPERRVDSVRITDLQEQHQYGALVPTLPPVIEITHPVLGDTVRGETTLEWELSDPDTPLATTMVHVVYSPDDGMSWRPIAVAIPGSQTGTTFDSGDLEPSNGHGVIRAMVSDGLRGDGAVVGGLFVIGGSSGVEEGWTQGGAAFALSVSPSPFVTETVVRFRAPVGGHVKVKVYDVHGRLVRTMHDGYLAAGPQVLKWSGEGPGGKHVAAGVYVIRVEGDGYASDVRVVVIQ